jgi:hypothetical protein
MEVVMKNNKITVGFLSSKLKDVLGGDFKRKQNVYLLENEQEELSKRYPSSFEAKVEEITHLLYYPDYVLYAKKEKSLFLIRDYQRDGKFQKVVLRVVNKGEWDIAELTSLSPTLLEHINSLGTLTRLN